MIVKDHDLPMKLWKLESLNRRINREHSSYEIISENHRIVRAGDRGERSIDYYIDLIDHEHLRVFYDLRLPYLNYFFQMDTLILSKNFILIIEIKNIAGEIHFPRNIKQMIRIYDDEKEAFPDPLLQVNQHKLLLTRFFHQHALSLNIPIYTLVVFANQRSILHIDPSDSFHLNHVIPIQQFIFKFESIKNDNCDRSISDEHINQVENILMQHHTPYDENILDRFQLERKDILKGVICPKCGAIGMKRIYSTWLCQVCQSRWKDAHVQALRDYALLFGNTISNPEAREFLQIDSKDVVRYLFKKINSPRIGIGKATRYDLSSLIYEPQY